MTVMSAERAVLPLAPEKALRRQVLAYAELTGWLSYFTWASLHSPAGFPDLVMVRRGQLVFAELKSDRRYLTPAQRKWLWALAAAGAEVYLWKPSTWSQIESVLR